MSLAPFVIAAVRRALMAPNLNSPKSRKAEDVAARQKLWRRPKSTETLAKLSPADQAVV